MGLWKRWFGAEGRERRRQRKRANAYLSNLAQAIRKGEVSLTFTEPRSLGWSNGMAAASCRYAGSRVDAFVHVFRSHIAQGYYEDSCVCVDGTAFGLDYSGTLEVLDVLLERLNCDLTAQTTAEQLAREVMQQAMAAKLPEG